jgi:hypothetical protein
MPPPRACPTHWESRVPDPTETLRPLYRMRQLALDLESALARDDMEMMTQAAGLLAPALANCQAAVASRSLSAGEAAEVALATRHTLNECEATLLRAMAQIKCEMRRLQQGKRTVVSVRPYPTGGSGRKLDTSR